MSLFNKYKWLKPLVIIILIFLIAYIIVKKLKLFNSNKTKDKKNKRVNKIKEAFRYFHQRLLTSSSDSILSTDPVTWVNDWQRSPEFAKYSLKAFTVEGNNLYLSDDVLKFKPLLGPFVNDPNENSVFIYNKADPNSSNILLRSKKQLITYGIKNRCNIPVSTDGTDYSSLCNGLVNFVDTTLVDKYNTQFEQTVNSNGTPFLLHSATKLMISYITVTKELVDAVNMYPINMPNAQWNIFYLSDIPDITFNIGAYMQPGDIVPLVYIGNGLANEFPKVVQIQLSSKYVKTVNAADTFGYTTKKFDVVLNSYSKLTTNGNWIVQVPTNPTSISNFELRRMYYLPFSPKLWIFRTKPNIDDGTSDWEFSMPGLATNCTSSQIYFNGKCTECGTNMMPDSSKSECISNCPAGTFLYSNSCQACNGVVSDDKLTCFVGGKKLLGKVYQNRPSEVQMEDGTFIGITDLLTFMAGPADDSGSECFRYRSCGWSAPWDCIVDAYNYVSDRAKDFGSFLADALTNVGDWAKNIGSAALNWAQNAGKSILEGLIKIGNAISCAARKVFRAIASFFGDIFAKIKQGVMEAVNWLKGAAGKVWDAIKGPLGTVINLVLQNSECEYSINRQISSLEAVKAIEPMILPEIRIYILQLVKNILSEATGGILYPILTIVLPLVDPYIAPYIDDILAKAIETDVLTTGITTIFDPVVEQIAKVSCSSFTPPDTSKIDIKIRDNLVMDDFQ